MAMGNRYQPLDSGFLQAFLCPAIGVSLTLLWYHGVNMTPGLFDRLIIPNGKIKSITLSLYFFHRFLLTISICATFNLTFFSIVNFRFNLSGVILTPWYRLG